jgi:hypothetical protein
MLKLEAMVGNGYEREFAEAPQAKTGHRRPDRTSPK